MKKYQPADFWEKRYQTFDITTSGHVDLPFDYNVWLYRIKSEKIAKVITNTFTDLSGKELLELGCGTGAYLSLWNTLEINSVTGVDISQASAKNLSLEYPHLKFYCHDISTPDLPDILEEKQYDIVTAIGVLVHIVDDADMESALKNISNLTSDDGLILISDYLLRGDQPDTDHTYMKFRNLDSFKKKLSSAGIEVVSTVPFYYFMMTPFDTPFFLERALLSRIFTYLRKGIRRHPETMGKLLYSLDSFLTRIISNGPSEKLLICRKI